MEALRLSTTYTRPSYFSAAMSALWQVPESSAEMVMTTASSSGPSTRSYTSSNSDGEGWLVVGSTSPSMSFS